MGSCPAASPREPATLPPCADLRHRRAKIPANAKSPPPICPERGQEPPTSDDRIPWASGPTRELCPVGRRSLISPVALAAAERPRPAAPSTFHFRQAAPFPLLATLLYPLQIVPVVAPGPAGSIAIPGAPLPCPRPIPAPAGSCAELLR